MNKYYNGLLVAVVISANGLTASENGTKLVFDEATQNRMKKTAKYYGYGYLGAWGLSNFANVAFVTAFSPFGVVAGMLAGSLGESKAADNMIKEALSPLSNIRRINRGICKDLLKTTPFTAPVVFGSAFAWDQYKKMRDEKNFQSNSNE